MELRKAFPYSKARVLRGEDSPEDITRRGFAVVGEEFKVGLESAKELLARIAGRSKGSENGPKE
jgi:hypothetical protein